MNLPLLIVSIFRSVIPSRADLLDNIIKTQTAEAEAEASRTTQDNTQHTHIQAQPTLKTSEYRS